MSYPQHVTLDEALESIMEALSDKLIASEDLSEVKDVVRYDCARPKPQMPSLWLFPEMMSCAHNPRTFAETWKIPISVVSLVKSQTPEEGIKKANDFALKARSVIISDRGLGNRRFVQDIKSISFDPAKPNQHDNKSLYGAMAVIEITVLICEERRHI